MSHILELLDVEARPSIRSSGSGPDDPPIIDVQGEDAGLIIGRRGDTLRALQFLTNVVLSRKQEEPTHVIVDVEQYRERRMAHLRQLANRMAERATASGRAVTLEPMPPADRRMIHVTLADNKGVTTGSSGEGSERRVTIEPTGEVAPSPQATTRGRGRRGRPAERRQENAGPRPEADEPQPDAYEPEPEGAALEDDDDQPQPDQLEPVDDRPEPEGDEFEGDDDQPQPDQLEPEDDKPQPEDDGLDDDEPQPDQIEPEDDEFEDDDDAPQPGNR